jgi:hypothetical protein
MNISLASGSLISVLIPCLRLMYSPSEAPSSVLSLRMLISISSMRKHAWVCVVVSPLWSRGSASNMSFPNIAAFTCTCWWGCLRKLCHMRILLMRNSMLQGAIFQNLKTFSLHMLRCMYLCANGGCAAKVVSTKCALPIIATRRYLHSLESIWSVCDFKYGIT